MRHSLPFLPGSHSAMDQEKPYLSQHPSLLTPGKGEGCKLGGQLVPTTTSKKLNQSKPQFLIHEIEIIIELISGACCIDEIR